MKHNRLQKLVLAALLAALDCVATMVISIPIPATNGYINLGDGFVLLGAFLLGPVYGMAAAGLGATLADVLLGYALYAPGTLVIKALMAPSAAWIFRAMHERTAGLILGAAVGELWMILGYFAYEALLLGYGMAAAGSIPANAVQGAAGMIVSIICCKALRAVPSIRKFCC